MNIHSAIVGFYLRTDERTAVLIRSLHVGE